MLLDSFSGVESAAPAVQVPKLVYYSFVTMTTLGYGDITPLKPATGTLAYLRS
ncbi:MAG: ion channel [Gammaproteobacteria bacterium]|nr:ion channel [Gammaproteobacteria bacterium]